MVTAPNLIAVHHGYGFGQSLLMCFLASAIDE